MSFLRVAAATLLLPLAVAGCSVASGTAGDLPGDASSERAAEATVASPPQTSSEPSRGAVPQAPSERSTAAPSDASTPAASDGRPAAATLSIPAIGLRELRVVPYRGSPDDGPGTRIQDGGVAASPYGPRGGVGPGGIGNYLVTAHRTSSTRAFERLPELQVGQRVHVVTRGVRYTYRITTTRSTSFRSRASLARQAAAVPGRPGRVPTRAMITLSTCATPEDHARGNYWADQYGNPEHRIDKVGVLVSRVPA